MNAWCVVDDVEYELDCIIYATGFEVSPDHVRRGGFELYGREGVSLTEHWADGMRTLHGMQTRGFPNLFLIQNSQAALTANFVHLIDVSATHIAYIVGHSLHHGIQVVEVSEEAETEWVEKIVGSGTPILGGAAYQAECTPGYYNNEGQPNNTP